MKSSRSLLSSVALLMLPLASLAAAPAAGTPVEAPAQAQASTAPADAPKTFAQSLQKAGVKLTAGPAKVALGNVAEYDLPAGQHFVGAESLDLFFKLTKNMRGGNEVGVVLSDEHWMMFFDYDEVGYVKDDDKDKLDADKLMKALTEGQERGNAQRKEQGWDEMRLVGWAAAPHYDEKTNNLKWALKLSSSADNYQEVWINESIRLLGRGGYMNVTLVANPELFADASRAAGALLASNFAYSSGQKYAEWKQGDKVAAYGLSALVLGGGAVAAAKMGLLSNLGVLLAKGWKVVVLGVGALGAGIAKLFRRVSGSQPKE
jgi:uncharacterized membrane-anchored protein